MKTNKQRSTRPYRCSNNINCYLFPLVVGYEHNPAMVSFQSWVPRYSRGQEKSRHITGVPIGLPFLVSISKLGSDIGLKIQTIIIRIIRVYLSVRMNLNDRIPIDSPEFRRSHLCIRSLIQRYSDCRFRFTMRERLARIRAFEHTLILG